MRIEESKIKSVLKAVMKQQGIQYKHLSKSLKVSEATVKRRLNQGELSISQLAEIADVLGVPIYEILEISKEKQMKPYLFSVEQEKLLASDLNMLLLFRAIIMGQTFLQLEAHFNTKDLRAKLRKLEEVELIKLMPQDRIVSLAHFPFSWRPDGQLQKAYFKKNLSSLFRHAEMNFTRSKYEDRKGVLCMPFEFMLSSQQQADFARELMTTYTKYLGISNMELKAKTKTGAAVSGLLLLDQFSIWSLPEKL